MTVWRMRISSWITEATYAHSEYVILIAFSPQQWLQERASDVNVKRTLPVLFRRTLAVLYVLGVDFSSLYPLKIQVHRIQFLIVTCIVGRANRVLRGCRRIICVASCGDVADAPVSCAVPAHILFNR